MKENKTERIHRLRREEPEVWTVRGVSKETRQAVTLAARRRGQKLGAFIEETLRRGATEALQGNTLPAPRQEELLEQILGRMDRMATSMETVSKENVTLTARIEEITGQQASDRQRLAELETERTKRRPFLARLFRQH